MFKKTAVLALAAAAMTSAAFAQEGSVPTGVPYLDHVFLIMMENHGYEQVIDNPNEPYLNSLINKHEVNLATNYFAVGHPSLTNYLEIVGGSNFGIRSDNSPNWGKDCSPNIATGIVNADDAGGPTAKGAPSKIDTGDICPIWGSGTDQATPAVDTWNEVGGPFVALADIDGVKSVPAAKTMGMTIADQLAAVGLQWKTYQESLPPGNIYGIDYSNGETTNLSDFKLLRPLTSSDVVQLYAVKHNPFAYFKSVQDGTTDGSSLANVVGFGALYSDLATGNLPSFSYIVPNQCDDQHGRSNADAFCAFDYGTMPSGSGYTYGTQAGLNAGLALQGDVTIQRIVEAIQASPAWQLGRNAIIIVWDENDYSGITKSQTVAPGTKYPLPNQNRVVLTVQTNYQGKQVGKSGKYYNSYSILKSLEAAFGLPCLNHACDSTTAVMSDLFALPAQP
jgi:phosphatidylinositol-3-phosphatase